MSPFRATTPFVLALAAILVCLASAPSALGKDDRRVVKTGRCSAGSTWKLKLKAEDGRIETEFEVDQNRAGVRWTVVLRRNGSIVFNGTRRTRGPSGSFTVRRLLSNRAGADRITARATRASGEVCRGSATFT